MIFFFFFFFFFSGQAARGRGGGGEGCQTFFIYFFPYSADHERDWPPCKVVFFGLATNALNVRNNNNNGWRAGITLDDFWGGFEVVGRW